MIHILRQVQDGHDSEQGCQGNIMHWNVFFKTPQIVKCTKLWLNKNIRTVMLSCGLMWCKIRNFTHSHNRTRLFAFLTASLWLATIIVHNRNSSQGILSFVLVLTTTHFGALLHGGKLNISKAHKSHLSCILQRDPQAGEDPKWIFSSWGWGRTNLEKWINICSLSKWF